MYNTLIPLYYLVMLSQPSQTLEKWNVNWLGIGIRGGDEKGCEMDINSVDRQPVWKRQVDQLEKGKTVVFKRSTSTVLPFSSGRCWPSTSTTAFFMVDSRQPFSSRPIAIGCVSLSNMKENIKHRQRIKIIIVASPSSQYQHGSLVVHWLLVQGD